MKAVFVRAPFNYDTMIASNEVGLKCPEPTLTIQSSKDEADINVIVERFTKTGMLPVRQLPPMGDEFHEIFDFRSAMDTVRAAEVAFMTMDAKTRLRFNNDPHLFVDFCSDPANLDEMVKMGFATRRENVNAGINTDAGAKGKAPGGDAGKVEAGAGAGS